MQACMYGPAVESGYKSATFDVRRNSRRSLDDAGPVRYTGAAAASEAGVLVPCRIAANVPGRIRRR
jgi:hypothetical protein